MTAAPSATSSMTEFSHPLHIRLLTHNIRYATIAPFEGEEKWQFRKPRIIAELHFTTRHYRESFICLQEVLHEQLHDILSGLNSKEGIWAYIGVGRDDGHRAGEYSPILYQPAVWLLESYKTVWLSETPDRPSKSWDAASIRILTIGVFQHCQSKKKIVAMNTHLDDQGSKSRREAARIILGHISQFLTEVRGSTAQPIFLAGDFNSEPDQEAYRTMTDEHSPMRDLQTLVPENQRFGDANTFTGFGYESSQSKRIDFLFLNHQSLFPSTTFHEDTFLNKTSPWGIEGYSVLPNRFEDRVYCSDHRAVIGDVVLH